MHIVIISSSAKILLGLRKELIAGWLDKGYKVTAIGELPVDDFAKKCRINGFDYRCITLVRNGLNPFKDLKTLLELTQMLKELQPDYVFCTLAKAISYGCWAAKLARIQNVYALISGLGSVFRVESVKMKMIRVVMSYLYKNAFRCCKRVIFQNNDDLSLMVDAGLLDVTKTAIVNGSGVDLVKYQYHQILNNHTFLFVGRLLREKGIREYIRASEIVKQYIPQARFIVVGDIDSNPSSLTIDELSDYQKSGVLEFYGFQEDVRPFLVESTIFVFPSYHEGTPRCVLEAMAIGRPVITTDAPGCRETVIDGYNGFIVPVGDVSQLADRMKSLITNKQMTTEMGVKSREIAEAKYDVNKVVMDYLQIMELD